MWDLTGVIFYNWFTVMLAQLDKLLKKTLLNCTLNLDELCDFKIRCNK